jgi:hypothetical protein
VKLLLILGLAPALWAVNPASLPECVAGAKTVFLRNDTKDYKTFDYLRDKLGGMDRCSPEFLQSHGTSILSLNQRRRTNCSDGMLLSRPFPADHNARPREPTRRADRVGRGGVGEKPLEGFAPTGPAPPNHHPISYTLRRAGTQKGQRQEIASKAAAPLGQKK